MTGEMRSLHPQGHAPAAARARPTRRWSRGRWPTCAPPATPARFAARAASTSRRVVEALRLLTAPAGENYLAPESIPAERSARAAAGGAGRRAAQVHGVSGRRSAPRERGRAHEDRLLPRLHAQDAGPEPGDSAPGLALPRSASRREELPRWNCCGAVFSLGRRRSDPPPGAGPRTDPGKDAGHRAVVTLCSQCYNTLARANLLMQEDAEKRKTLNLFMEEETDYAGEVEVLHYLELLRPRWAGTSSAPRSRRPARGAAGGALLRVHAAAARARSAIDAARGSAGSSRTSCARSAPRRSTSRRRPPAAALPDPRQHESAAPRRLRQRAPRGLEPGRGGAGHAAARSASTTWAGASRTRGRGTAELPESRPSTSPSYSRWPWASPASSLGLQLNERAPRSCCPRTSATWPAA